MAKNPMTYSDALNSALSLDLSDDVRTTLEALLTSINKRNSSDRKPSKAQEANADIKNDILALLADGTARTVTEIMQGVVSLASASNQKATALVGQLVSDGLVKRETVKRKAYFSIIQ